MGILITGEKGFVGSRLAEFLKGSGRKVFFLEKDLIDREGILSCNFGEPIEAIVHLAGIIGGRKTEDFQRINVEGTRNIVDLGRKLGVKKIVFISSLRVISSRSDPYIDSKREAEKIVAESGLLYVILRPSLIYGPGDNKNITQLVRLMKCLPLVPAFNFSVQPVFIDDVAVAISKCLDLSASQVINMAGSQTVSYIDLANLLRAKGYKIKLLMAPRFFGVCLKLVSCLPFFPIAPWQAETLLTSEVFSEYYWKALLEIKETDFPDGLDKLLKTI